uniref:CN hydrolase domain-containing protein n=1 Tax=Sexangularia sp. CB-2014 TaxID=1486929 RepID=A0A7S1VMY1_9EUKA
MYGLFFVLLIHWCSASEVFVGVLTWNSGAEESFPLGPWQAQQATAARLVAPHLSPRRPTLDLLVTAEEALTPPPPNMSVAHALAQDLTNGTLWSAMEGLRAPAARSTLVWLPTRHAGTGNSVFSTAVLLPRPPSSTIPLNYGKTHPFDRSVFTPGTTGPLVVPLTATAAAAGVLICYDLLFTQPLCAYQHVNVLALPTWWVNLDARLAATPTQQALARSTGLAVAAAGPGDGYFNSGSGLYHGNGSVASVYFTNDPFVQVANVLAATLVDEPTSPQAGTFRAACASGPVETVESFPHGGSGNVTFHTLSGNSTGPMRAKVCVPRWSSSSTICCSVEFTEHPAPASASSSVPQPTTYALVVYSGWYGKTQDMFPHHVCSFAVASDLEHGSAADGFGWANSTTTSFASVSLAVTGVEGGPGMRPMSVVAHAGMVATNDYTTSPTGTALATQGAVVAASAFFFPRFAGTQSHRQNNVE